MTPPGSPQPQAPSRRAARAGGRLLRVVGPLEGEGPAPGAVMAPLSPGSFVWLRNHPEDLPPFQLIRCQGGRCWVRQQSWGRQVHWEVAHRRLRRAC